jgi:hypothetical protein
VSRLIDCPACGEGTNPATETRIANPWGWLCLVGGVAAFLLSLVALPLIVVSMALVGTGAFLRQTVVKCGECGHALRVGPTRFGKPSPAMLAGAIAFFALNFVLGVIGAMALYSAYMRTMNDFSF